MLKIKRTSRNSYPFLIFAGLLLLLGGCAAKVQEPVFYPGKPDLPRFQYLKSIHSAADLKQSLLSKSLAEGTFEFSKAYGIATFGSQLLVTDNRLRGYAVINIETNDLYFVSNDPNNSRSQINTPFGIAVDEKGSRYIADRRGHRVLVFDQNDNFIQSIDFNKETSSPVAVAVANEKVYIAQILQNRIDVYDLRSKALTEFQTGDSRLEWPTALDFRNGHLFITEMLNYRVSKFKPNGEFVTQYGNLGDGTGKLARPKGVAVDDDNRVLALDASFANFQIFREDGQLLGFVGQGGIEPENLTLPAGICISYELAPYFQKYAAPGFKLEYIVAVTTQAGPSKINIYGHGKMEGASYPE